MVRRTKPAFTKCPEEILSGTVKQKLEFFGRAIVKHEHLDEAVEEIVSLAAPIGEGTMIVLIGPAGVGKTVLGCLVRDRINRDFFAANPDDVHTIPAVRVKAWGSEKKSFDWKDFYEWLLRALQAPLVEKSLPEVIRDAGGLPLRLPQLDCRSKPSMSTFRGRVLTAIPLREPVIIVVDEASNVLFSESIVKLKKQGDTLRSLIDDSETSMLLCGAYELFELVVLSGQLARRGEVVHFKAYTQSETKGFAKLLTAMQEFMPVRGGVDLTPYSKLLHEQSLGCAGLLKKILMKALKLHLMQGKEIDEALILQCLFRPAQLRRLRRELFDGYRLVEEVQHPDYDRALVEEDEDEYEATEETRVRHSDRIRRGGHRIGTERPSRRALGKRRGA